ACVEERDHRTGGLAHDLSDQLERMLRGETETDQRNIGLLARGRSGDLADIDLARDDVVAKTSHHLREHGKPVALLIRDQHAQTTRWIGSRRDRRRLALLRSRAHQALRSALNVTPPVAAPP